MRLISSKVGCYFSTMLFFNVLHILKIFNDKNIDSSKWEFPSIENIKNIKWILPSLNNVKILILVIEILIGVVFLIKIITSMDDKLSANTKGKTYSIITLNDQTQCEYFGKYSLLILTSLSLPTTNSVFAFVIFFFVQLTIGIVYVYYNLIYINPILSLFKYRTYVCDCKNSDSGSKNLIVITRRVLKASDTINIRNTNNKVIKLGNKQFNT